MPLFIFGMLIAWDFAAVHKLLIAIPIGIGIAVVFVIFVKVTGIKPGWPKD